MSKNDPDDSNVIAVLSVRLTRQIASTHIEKLIQTCDALRKHGLISVAKQVEQSFFDIYESDGTHVLVPITMELRNAQTDDQIWAYSDIAGFSCEGLAIPGLSTPVSAEHRAQVITFNSLRYSN